MPPTPVKAVWMLRHYQEVARSNVARFGMDNPYRDLQPIRSRDALDWRYRGVTEETCETVTALSNRDLTHFDAAALFWWTRNQLYFDQRLWEDDRIRILRYERACNQPDEVIGSLSDHIGVALPRRSIASRVRPQPFPPKTQAARSGRRATLQEAVGFVRRPPRTVAGMSRTVSEADPSEGPASRESSR